MDITVAAIYSGDPIKHPFTRSGSTDAANDELPKNISPDEKEESSTNSNLIDQSNAGNTLVVSYDTRHSEATSGNSLNHRMGFHYQNQRLGSSSNVRRVDDHRPGPNVEPAATTATSATDESDAGQDEPRSAALRRTPEIFVDDHFDYTLSTHHPRNLPSRDDSGDEYSGNGNNDNINLNFNRHISNNNRQVERVRSNGAASAFSEDAVNPSSPLRSHSRSTSPDLGQFLPGGNGDSNVARGSPHSARRANGNLGSDELRSPHLVGENERHRSPPPPPFVNRQVERQPLPPPQSVETPAILRNVKPTSLHAPSQSFGRPYKPPYVPPYAGFDTGPVSNQRSASTATLIPFIPVTNQPIHSHNTEPNPPRRRNKNQNVNQSTRPPPPFAPSSSLSHPDTSNVHLTSGERGGPVHVTTTTEKLHFPLRNSDRGLIEVPRPVSNANRNRLQLNFPPHREIPSYSPAPSIRDSLSSFSPDSQPDPVTDGHQLPPDREAIGHIATSTLPPYIRLRTTSSATFPPQFAPVPRVTHSSRLPHPVTNAISTTTNPPPPPPPTTASTTTTTSRPFGRSIIGHKLLPEHGQPLGLLDYDSITEAPASPAPTKPSRRVKQVRKSRKKQQQQPQEPVVSSDTSHSSGPRIRGPHAKRPDAHFRTPNALSTAEKCDHKVCRLPDCNCASAKIPGGLRVRDVPQMVLLTFDDAVNDLNWELYEELFNSGRKNPNGCPPLGTFYVSHEWTDYSQVQTLYARGHEMASHGVTHSFGEKFSKNQWMREINGQREILHLYGGVKMEDIRGMRAPFLQIGGNRQFEMLWDANFTYDSSMPVFENNPPYWPYTLDYAISHECMITPCPTKSFPGLWEVGMVMWQDLRGGRCSMVDACQAPDTADDVHKMMMDNFNRHYKSNRAPFGIFYHSAWFNQDHRRKGFIRFMDEIMSKDDVYFITNWQMIQWMRNPTPLSRINSFQAWSCDKESVQSECPNPRVCSVRHSEGSRFLKTCQVCPTHYPWVGKTNS